MTIGEVSEKFQITADTLRYYERIGLIPPVPRKKNGIRDFDEQACKWVGFVKCMRNAGVQIEPLIEYVSLLQKGTGIERRKQILIEQRARLHRQQSDRVPAPHCCLRSEQRTFLRLRFRSGSSRIQL